MFHKSGLANSVMSYSFTLALSALTNSSNTSLDLNLFEAIRCFFHTLKGQKMNATNFSKTQVTYF